MKNTTAIAKIEKILNEKLSDVYSETNSYGVSTTTYEGTGNIQVIVREKNGKFLSAETFDKKSFERSAINF